MKFIELSNEFFCQKFRLDTLHITAIFAIFANFQVFSRSVFRFFMVNKVSKRVVLISTIVGKRHKASKMANFPVLLTDGGHFLSLASSQFPVDFSR